MGAPTGDVKGNHDAAREILNAKGMVQEVTMCDTILADLYLREGNMLVQDSL
jgi:hypothetical protein